MTVSFISSLKRIQIKNNVIQELQIGKQKAGGCITE
jgi:hypothetical protein